MHPTWVWIYLRLEASRIVFFTSDRKSIPVFKFQRRQTFIDVRPIWEFSGEFPLKAYWRMLFPHCIRPCVWIYLIIKARQIFIFRAANRRGLLWRFVWNIVASSMIPTGCLNSFARRCVPNDFSTSYRRSMPSLNCSGGNLLTSQGFLAIRKNTEIISSKDYIS